MASLRRSGFAVDNDLHIRTEDALSVQGIDVASLADFVQQASADTMMAWLIAGKLADDGLLRGRCDAGDSACKVRPNPQNGIRRGWRAARFGFIADLKRAPLRCATRVP